MSGAVHNNDWEYYCGSRIYGITYFLYSSRREAMGHIMLPSHAHDKICFRVMLVYILASMPEITVFFFFINIY